MNTNTKDKATMDTNDLLAIHGRPLDLECQGPVIEALVAGLAFIEGKYGMASDEADEVRETIAGELGRG